MAKNNNLQDFLLDLANTIRTKKGSTSLINPQDFSKEISSIDTVNNQSKSVSITSNSVVNITPDDDYTGLSKVSITVNVTSPKFYNADITLKDNSVFGYNPSNISKISFHGGVKKIEEKSFYYDIVSSGPTNQPNIEVIFPSTLTTIGDYAFFGVNFTTATTLPQSITNIGKGVFSYAGGDFTIDCNLPDVSESRLEDGPFYNFGKFTDYPIPLKFGPNCHFLGKYSLYDCFISVESFEESNLIRLGQGVFKEVSFETRHLSFPKTLVYIDAGAFKNSSLMRPSYPGETVEWFLDFSNCDYVPILEYDYEFLPSLDPSYNTTENSLANFWELYLKKIYVPKGRLEEWRRAAPWSSIYYSYLSEIPDEDTITTTTTTTPVPSEGDEGSSITTTSKP